MSLNLVDFELLEGMANETVSVLQKQGARIILYTPIVAKNQFNSAIAYLVRRLDEGTQEEISSKKVTNSNKTVKRGSI